MARPLRYTLILALVAIGASLAAVGGWRYARASAPVPGPIVLVSIDTLRADHLPAYGYGKIRTPALDTLARDGVVFERAYAHVPQTLAAHVAILSGRLPFETGVHDDAGGAVKADERLLAQMLRERGYATAGFVSSGLLRHETGIARGFDVFDDQMPAADAELEPFELRRDGAESEALAERWLSAVGSVRVFLFLHLHEAHAPYRPPERFGAMAPYDGAIEYADEIVGRLVRYLKTHELYDQSTIVVVADHGEGLGDHGEQEHGLFVYDSTIHVPLLFKQAGGVDAGRRVTDPVQQIDIVPTILDLAKAPVPGNLRGRSLKSLADGTGPLSGLVVYSEAAYGRNRFGWSELQSVTDGRFQYIKAPREELYDLDADPRQRDNIITDASRSRQPRETLRQALDGLISAEAGAPGPHDEGADPKDTRGTAEQYRAALALTTERKWLQAIDALQAVLRDQPDAAEAWSQLVRVATLAERYDVARDACGRLVELKPLDVAALDTAANVSLLARRLDEARDYAARAVAAAGRDPSSQASAHTMLARIALARHDADEARDQAMRAQQAQPGTVLPLYVEASLLSDQGDYEAALSLVERASADLKKANGPQIPGLHYLTGDLLIRAERLPEAEAQFLEELRHFPHDLRARAALGMLYQSTDRREEAAGVAEDLVRITPTPEAYSLASKLWMSLGDRGHAESAGLEARRLQRVKSSKS